MAATLYPSPNVEVEAQNQLDIERAKAEKAATDEATAKAVDAAKAAIKDKIEQDKKIAAARAKVESDFAKEEARIQAEASKPKVVKTEVKTETVAEKATVESDKVKQPVK